jgi:RNA polymerase sigma-70 factor, ECF subfamily
VNRGRPPDPRLPRQAPRGWLPAVTAGTEAEEQLVAAARRGDADALERLLERVQGRVLRFAMKMCGDPEDAREVLQETLIAVARSLRDFAGASSLSTWLYKIAHSFCIKRRRTSKFAPARVVSLETEAPQEAAVLRDPARAPDEALLGRELEVALQQAFSTLPPEQREVLLLRDVEGLSAAEVAEVLGTSVEAVKSRLHRARVVVRERLAPLLQGEESPASRDCPDVLTRYSQHLEGEIAPELCRDLEAHLGGCRRCTQACESLRKTLHLCAAVPLPRVPPELQASVRQAARTVMASS